MNIISHKNFISFFIIPLVFIQNLLGQGTKYKNYDYKWETNSPPPISVEEKNAKEDAVILQEENMIWITQHVFSKHIRLKYLNQNGVAKYSRFVLPDSYDPLADKYDLEYSKRDTTLRPRGEFNSIRYFTPRIIKPDGKVSKAEYDVNTQSEIVRYKQMDHTFYSWVFNIKGIQPGDELEIQYAYENVYNAKAPYRVYFSGELTKQNYSLKIRYKNGDLYFFQYHNGAEPQDSIVNKETSPETYEYLWIRKDIPGCINEKGARLHKELPFVTFYQHQRDYNDKGMEVNYSAKQFPYPWEFAYRYMIDTYPTHPNYYLNKWDKNTVAFNNYFKSITQSLTDTSAYAKFLALHQDIVNNFKFDDDREFYSGDDTRLERIPEFIEEKILRASSRYHIYKALAFRLASPYFQVNLFDKRFEEMDFDCYYPMQISQRFFCLPYKNTYLFFYPKHSRFGYDCNELPFYYEDINAMLIPQTIPEEEMYKRVQEIKYVKTKTPYSNVNDNSRNTLSMVTISTDSLKAVFETKLILSGQFSTLTRGFYLYGSIDTSINPGYYKPVYQLTKRTKLISKEMTSHIKAFPFTTNFKLNYVSDDLFTRINENTVKLPLQNFFNNITEVVDTTRKRYLSYYPDFEFMDQHKYILKFDKPVEIKNASDFNYTINNSLGNYKCSLLKLEDNMWSLETVFTINNEKVTPEKFHDVIEIYSAIQKMDRSFLFLNFQK